MAETYSNGVWHVKDGEEDAFVEAWREFALWGHTWPGCGTLRLVRDRHEPSRYMSFGPWGELRGPAGVEGRSRVPGAHRPRPAAHGRVHALGLRARDHRGVSASAGAPGVVHRRDGYERPERRPTFVLDSDTRSRHP